MKYYIIQQIINDLEYRILNEEPLILLGLKDENENLVLSLEYDEISEIHDDFVWVIKGNQIRLFNLKTREYLYAPSENEEILDINNRVSKIYVNSTRKYGYINYMGEKICDCIYDGISPFYTHIGFIKKKQLYAIINLQGKIIIDFCIVDYFGLENERFLIKTLNGEIIELNSEGKIIQILDYEDVNVLFYNEKEIALFAVKKNGFWGISNKELVLICDYMFIEIKMATDWTNLFAAAKEINKFGFIDCYGKEIIPFIYSMAYAFNNDIAIVQKNNKFGAINKDNQTIIPFVYKKLDDEYERIFAVYKKYFFYINHEGIYQPQFRSGKYKYFLKKNIMSNH